MIEVLTNPLETHIREGCRKPAQSKQALRVEIDSADP